MTDHQPGFNTRAIHAGALPDPTTGARATPIYQTASFVFDDAEHAASLFGLEAFGNIYSRITNPTNAVLEERVAALEGGTAAVAVASGHAAEFLVMHALMQPGDEFIAADRLYGGSINQFNHSYKNFGWNVVWADTDDPASFEAAITPRTKAIFCESIANPGGVITDIAALSEIAKRHNIPLIVDNTMASPYLIRPFEHGADILKTYGVTREDIVTGRGGPGLLRAAADLRALARRHLKAYEAARATIAPAARPAFLAVALVEPYLAAMERPGYDPLNTVVEIPRWRRLWTLWRASRRG